MYKWKKYIPEGMRDILFEECISKVKIENEFRSLYLNAGFEEVISPTIEFYDVFNGEDQPMEQEKMYKLFDNQGRILVLRPDMTTPIARIAATKLKDKGIPLKLCYTSNIFRINENFNGKMNEITQSGIEIIGTDNLKADAQVIIIGINALLSAGLKNFKIELGQAEFFKGLTEDVDMSFEDIEKLRNLIENKNFASLKTFIDGNIEFIRPNAEAILRELPSLFGGIEVIKKAKEMTANKSALEALESLEQVYLMLDEIGLSSYLSIDLGMVHHINYYTGIIFRGYSNEVGNEILSGGRYDKLLGRFGDAMPATGLAINVDNILLSLKKQSNETKVQKTNFLIYYEKGFLKEAYNTAILIRRSNLEAELSVSEEYEEALKYAKSKNKKYFITFSNDKRLVIKDLKNDEFEELEISEFKEYLFNVIRRGIN
ncbi:MAG: ATP phosphoribosyltransferase regulatory subunit [Clostridiaceae bacterium]|nr:ATP phosphoribosyltransferase regulatory subunit [Clostridiaceae bacterium]